MKNLETGRSTPGVKLFFEHEIVSGEALMCVKTWGSWTRGSAFQFWSLLESSVAQLSSKVSRNQNVVEITHLLFPSYLLVK